MGTAFRRNCKTLYVIIYASAKVVLKIAIYNEKLPHKHSKIYNKTIKIKKLKKRLADREHHIYIMPQKWAKVSINDKNYSQAHPAFDNLHRSITLCLTCFGVRVL